MENRNISTTCFQIRKTANRLSKNNRVKLREAVFGKNVLFHYVNGLSFDFLVGTKRMRLSFLKTIVLS